MVSRRLLAVTVIAPVVFVVGMEVMHNSFGTVPWLSRQFVHAWRVPLIVAVSAVIAAFTALMVRSIWRAEQAIMRQNGDLRLADAVSAASHGRGDARSIADAVANALLGTLVDGVDLTLLPDGEDAIEARAGHSGDSDGPPDLDVPLREGDRTVGHLRLWGPNADDLRAGVGPATLSALATQVAGAAQLATDVASLHRRRDEGHAFYAILLSISRQSGTLPTLTSLAGYARDLLDTDAAAVIVDVATANMVRFDSDEDVPQACSDGTTLLGVGLPDHLDPSTGARVSPIGCHHWTSFVDQEVTGPSGSLGRLWVGRRDPLPFTARDRAFLGTMAGLAGIALTGGLVREQARRREVLDERTRIAREMHDSLAQVLGALHLRLRMLQTFGAVTRDAETSAEVDALADICDEAYRDVREVILGLRDADKAHLGLEASLRDYIAKYAAQSGIAARFHNETGGALTLSPRTEVHLVRVVQEALTNVRKHARATNATVTVTASETSTTFTIADDGQGFHAHRSSPSDEGYGLFTMRDRMSLLRGTLTVSSSPGRGTRVVATVPERTDNERTDTAGKALP